MAEETIVKVLDVEIRASDTVKQLAALKQQATELRKEQKALDLSTKEGREAYVAYTAQIKAVNAEASKLERQITNDIKAQNQAKGSLNQLSSELNNMKAEYRELSEEVRQSPFGVQMQQDIDALNTKLKEAEAAYGDNQRSVGDYAIAGKALTQELGEITDKLYELATAGQRGSKEYETLAKKAQDLRKAQQEVDAEIDAGGSLTKNLDGLMQAVSGVTSAYTLWQSASQLLGIQNEELEATMQKVVIATTALNALQQIQISLQKQSAAVILAKTVATKAATAAQWLWNAAMAANPIGAVVAAIAGLVTGIVALGKALTQSSGTKQLKAETEAAREAAEEYEEYKNTREEAAEQSERDAKAQSAATDALIAQRRAEGATEEELAAIKKQAADEASEAAIQKAEAENESAKATLKSTETTLAALRAEMAVFEARGKTHKKAYKEAAEEAAKLQKIIDELNASIDENNTRITKENTAILDRNTDARERNAQAARSALDREYQQLVQQSERMQALQESNIKAEAGYLKDDEVTRMYYEQRLANIAEKGQRERLALQLKYGQITREDYLYQLAQMDAEAEARQKENINRTNKYYEDLRKTILDNVKKTEDEEVAEVNAKYDRMLQDLEKAASDYAAPVRIEGMSEEEYQAELDKFDEFRLNQLKLETAIEQQREEDIKAIRDNALSEQLKSIEEAYADDLKKFTDNEGEKLKVQEKILREQIEVRRKAGQETGDLEAQLRANLSAQNAIGMAAELSSTEHTAKQEYEIKMKYLQAQYELYQGNKEKQAEILDQMNQVHQEYLDKTNENIEKAFETFDKLKERMTEIDAIFSQAEESELKKAEDYNERQKNILQSRLDNGLITQKEYEAEVTKLDEELDKKTAEIERRQAIRQRAMSIYSVILDTAKAIAKTFAQLGWPAGIPGSIYLAAMGAAQVATIAAAPLPKAARGRLITGRTHAKGGEVIEAEAGEAIINRRATQMFLPLLSAINQAGGGVPFVAPYSDGGYAARYEAEKIDRSSIAQAVRTGLADMKIYTTIEDIRRADRRYTQVESRGNF